MCGPDDEMLIAQTFLSFVYFNVPETKTEVSGREKTKTEFKIPQPSNTNFIGLNLAKSETCPYVYNFMENGNFKFKFLFSN